MHIEVGDYATEEENEEDYEEEEELSVDDGSMLVIDGSFKGLEIPVKCLWLAEAVDLRAGRIARAEFRGLEITNCRELEGKAALLMLKRYERASADDVLRSQVSGSRRGEGREGREEGEVGKAEDEKGFMGRGGAIIDLETGEELPDGYFDELALGRDEVIDMVNQALTEGGASAVIVCTDSGIIGDALLSGTDGTGKVEEDYRFPKPCVLMVGFWDFELEEDACVDLCQGEAAGADAGLLGERRALLREADDRRRGDVLRLEEKVASTAFFKTMSSEVVGELVHCAGHR